jgi:hypothetical protein
MKKYIKNKKKNYRKRVKKNIEKNKPVLIYNEKIINVKLLNDTGLIEKIDCGYLNIKEWPLKYESYKKYLNNYKIMYFHNYYHHDYDVGNFVKKQVTIFYSGDNNKIIPKNITYNELYNLFIIEYNKQSVLEYIRYYYKNFNI